MVAPVLARLPYAGENVVVLHEVVGGAAPQVPVAHLIAFGDVVSLVVGLEAGTFVVPYQLLVEVIVPAQPGIVEVLVASYAGVSAVGAVEEAQIVVAGHYAVPGLAGMLVVAHILVADAKFAVKP